MTVLWRPTHEVGWYTLSLRPPRDTDNNRNTSARWLHSSNDIVTQRDTEITPHPGISSVSQPSTSLCQQTHYMEIRSDETLIQPTRSFTPYGSFQASTKISTCSHSSKSDDRLLFSDQFPLLSILGSTEQKQWDNIS